MASFRVTKAANADIENIGLYTEQTWGREQRVDYLNGLKLAFERLSQNPALAAERLDFEPPVRIYSYGKHLVVYVSDDLGILIVRVLHQRMNVAAHLSS